jgi:hypothetical protein
MRYAVTLLALACLPAWTAEPVVTLGPEVDVSAVFAHPELSQYQADLRCDPSDAKRMLITCKVATSLSEFEQRTMTYRTQDGGGSWAFDIEPASGDPDSVFDRGGRAHRSFIWDAKGKHTGYRCSTDGGATWETPLELPARDDHMHIACDRSAGPFADSIYIAGRNFSGKGVTVSRSRDHGATFQSTVIPLDGVLGKGFVYGPAVTATGTLVIPYTSGSTFLSKPVNGVATYAGKKQSVHILRSADGGLNFTRIQVGDIDASSEDGYGTSPNLSQIAVGRRAGGERLYLAYPRSRVAACSQLLLVTSDDDGATWSAPRAIIERESPTGFSPSSCSIMANAAGTVGVQWIAIDATATSFHLCFAASLDGGMTFGKPVQATPVPSIVPGGKLPIPAMKAGVRLPGQPRSPGQDQLYGDVDADGIFHLVWTDARTGDPMGNNPGYAIFTRTATVSETR